MPFIPVPGVTQVELVSSLNGQIVETVLHFENVTPTPTSMTELAEALVGWWSSDLRPLVTSVMSLINVKCTDLTTANSPVVDYGTGLPLVGTASGDPSPNSIAMVITKRTALRGRNFRGRIYHCGFTDFQIAGNNVDPAVVTALVTAYNNTLNFTTLSGEWWQVVVSRYSNNAPRPEGVPTRITALTTDGVVDSQRRRLPGRGQ